MERVSKSIKPADCVASRTEWRDTDRIAPRFRATTPAKLTQPRATFVRSGDDRRTLVGLGKPTGNLAHSTADQTHPARSWSSV